MVEEDLKNRLKQFAIRIINLVDHLPRNISTDAIARQIVRSGTSPAANYRAACVAKSEKDFLNKLKMVEEELDETVFWLELIVETGKLQEARVKPLYEEGKELLKIIVCSISTVRKRLNTDGEFLPKK